MRNIHVLSACAVTEDGVVPPSLGNRQIRSSSPTKEAAMCVAPRPRFLPLAGMTGTRIEFAQRLSSLVCSDSNNKVFAYTYGGVAMMSAAVGTSLMVDPSRSCICLWISVYYHP